MYCVYKTDAVATHCTELPIGVVKTGSERVVDGDGADAQQPDLAGGGISDSSFHLRSLFELLRS